MDIGYLRRLTSLSPKWSIEITEQTLPVDRFASLLWYDLELNIAIIAFNDRYIFSNSAWDKVLTHEFMELSLIELWEHDTLALEYISDIGIRENLRKRIRRSRDDYIERVLSKYPFWTELDRPVLKEELRNV